LETLAAPAIADDGTVVFSVAIDSPEASDGIFAIDKDGVRVLGLGLGMADSLAVNASLDVVLRFGGSRLAMWQKGAPRPVTIAQRRGVLPDGAAWDRIGSQPGMSDDGTVAFQATVRANDSPPFSLWCHGNGARRDLRGRSRRSARPEAFLAWRPGRRLSRLDRPDPARKAFSIGPFTAVPPFVIGFQVTEDISPRLVALARHAHAVLVRDGDSSPLGGTLSIHEGPVRSPRGVAFIASSGPGDGRPAAIFEAALPRRVGQ